MPIKNQTSRTNIIKNAGRQAQNGRVKRQELDRAIINELRSNFDKKFSKEEVVVLVSGSNGTKYYSASMSDIDVVIISTKSLKPDQRLDMDALTRSAKAIKRASKNLKEKDIILVAFAAVKTEPFIRELVMLSMAKTLGKGLNSVYMKPLHSLIYTSPGALTLWEGDISLSRCLVSRGDLIFGSEKEREKIMESLNAQTNTQTSPQRAKIIQAEVNLKEAYTIFRTNIFLSERVLWENTINSLKYISLHSGIAYMSHKYSIEVNTIHELSEHKEQLPEKAQELLDAYNGIRYGNGTSRGMGDLYRLAAEAVNECASGI